MVLYTSACTVWGVVAVITLYSLASHRVVDMAALGAADEWKVVAATDFPLSMRD